MLSPLPEARWNRQTAAHLLNRAAFGGSPAEVDRVTSLGLKAAVSELVDYESRPDLVTTGPWNKPNLERVARYAEAKNLPLEQKEMLKKQVRKEEMEEILGMRQEWLQRMVEGPRPFQEKMALFWHGQFATSLTKVRESYFMWHQNEIFRQNALGSWESMLIAVSKDPAMLLWLDGASSRPDHPNENFAREVMELFTLGEGHYTEEDIRAAARAFVGWGVDRKTLSFVERPRLELKEPVTFMGQTAKFSGEDILRHLASMPESASYLMNRLWTFFANDQPQPPVIASLAEVFSTSNRVLKPVMKTLFSSEEFYAPEVMRQQVKSPVQWLVSTCKYLELPLPSALLNQQALRQMGQELFAPPSVKGWDGGISWISTNALFSRYNLASLLVQGQGMIPDKFGKQEKERPALAAVMQRSLQPVDVEKLFPPQMRQSSETFIRALEDRLIQAPLRPARHAALTEYLAAHKTIDAGTMRGAMQLLMATPDFQLT